MKTDAAGAKALHLLALFSARLKSCPDTKQQIAEERSDQDKNPVIGNR
jgi:hypothetical protein